MSLLLTYIAKAYHHIIHKVKNLSRGKKTLLKEKPPA
ncbi:hypothetical protein BSUW23_03730 [Bacillus spizizenii str. W23]|uniref:Uncharacterized protein n=1 Tax=Bacillus spizizenii (strain ATCC 23059 / NRRL B-14472 / W23) TaxID=655816 RepID=E0TUY4_BACSH|nr:hypothetical protein BSUW23_03730 [Bacillus spizizenii str. W23]EFG91789.1 hypothetical protein BSU6633_11987 [Bacillus spizizenii ATCC 6633 = JCM 2499]